MKCNVSPLDAAIRAGLGLILLLSPLLDFRIYPYNYLGLVLFLTGAAGYCPLYSLANALFRASPAHMDKRSNVHG
jgi:hypothetical protein